ncbi:endonuclease/exonuclease/phosphatase family protein [Kitasatospora paranensis]|uniref:Endonuclease/exonuclease/phosphatase family protein n=1 Tax=Kitasatospora paranensis TaxID=258053 RepID=A0ABW2FWK6_9ACTN
MGERQRPERRRGWATVAAALLLALLTAGHRLVPDGGAHLGSLLEAFLPWLGLGVPVLLAVALWRRSRTALLAVLVPALAWTAVFGGRLLPADTGPADLTVLQHNVDDGNADPEGTARALLGRHADLVALEELASGEAVYERVLAHDYPYRARSGTVGLWSRYPLTDARPVDIKPAAVHVYWKRGVRATVRTPQGEVAVYVAHLPSVRVHATGFAAAGRDESARRLAAVIDAEPIRRVILLGDLNSTLDDRGLAPLTSRLTPARSGFDFSWPAGLPLARIDQVLCRGAVPVSTRTLAATGSDHLPVEVRIRL